MLDVSQRPDARVAAATAVTRNEALLSVEDLTVAYGAGENAVHAVRNLSFGVRRGEILAIVGESGSGKTSAALAALNYLPAGGRIAGGDVRFDGCSVLQLDRAARRRLYGRRMAHVSQDPAASLNPALRIGTQLTEGMIAQLGLERGEASMRARRLLDEVHLAEPVAVLDSYPHQLSGGMQQRVCIAMALACDAELIVMDEPTTGLDAATESAIFTLLKELRKGRELSVLFISHNLPAVGSLADRVLVMYGGRGVEEGPTARVFERPAHRYTAMLLRALPTMRSTDGMPTEIPWQGNAIPHTGCPFRDRCDIARSECAADTPLVELDAGRQSACVFARQLLEAPARRPLRSVLDASAVEPSPRVESGQEILEVADLDHVYRKSIWAVATHARKTLDDLSLSINEGEVLALIGESGSGKSTLARCIVGLESPIAGTLDFRGHDLARRGRRPLEISRRLQIVFQNIAGSLHPGKAIRSILSRPFQLYERRTPQESELADLVRIVGLKPEYLDKRPSSLSGGERQRVALTRATSSSPALVVLDEAFSALDVSLKVRVMRLLQDKRAAARMSMLLITHDLPIVRFMADRVAVLYRGWLCEVGPRTIIEMPPMHPYTETLMWSALELEGLRPRFLDVARAAAVDRAAADPAEGGCRFRHRCPRYLGQVCDTTTPPMREAGDGHGIACHIPIVELREVQAREWRSKHPEESENAA